MSGSLVKNPRDSPSHIQSQPEMRSEEMKGQISSITKTGCEKFQHTNVQACDSFMYFTANSTRCFDSGGLKRACSILASRGSVTRMRVHEYSKQHAPAR